MSTKRFLRKGSDVSRMISPSAFVDAADRRVSILGVPISPIDMALAIDRVATIIREKKPGYVCACDVHSLMHARKHESHLASLRKASLVVPDGMPLVWVSRLKGHKATSRVAGPDLLVEMCRMSESTGWKHYFYGGADGVAEQLANDLQARFPKLQVVGYETPPFRPLTDEERQHVVDRLKASGADVVWIGLGCPKQEVWMRDTIDMVGNRVMIGVGAAFDFQTGRVPRAPKWMRDRGLEWLHRLASEPRRLWRRYLVIAPQFVGECVLEFLRDTGHEGRRKPKAKAGKA